MTGDFKRGKYPTKSNFILMESHKFTILMVLQYTGFSKVCLELFYKNNEQKRICLFYSIFSTIIYFIFIF